MTATDLDAIRARAASALGWAQRDPCIKAEGCPDGWLPLSVREHFEHDLPALLAEVERLRATHGEAQQIGEGGPDDPSTEGCLTCAHHFAPWCIAPADPVPLTSLVTHCPLWTERS